MCTSFVALLFAGSATNAFPQSPGDFTTRADVVVTSGAPIVRAALPARSIAALRSNDAGDLRVFNSAGVSLPHALIDASTEQATLASAPGQRIAALPIYAASGAAAGSSGSAGTPTLRIEEGPTRRVIEYSSNAPAVATNRLEPRGLLFDTRKIDSAVRALELDAKLPLATIMKVSIDASTDLKTWRPLAADAPVYDFGVDGPKNRTVTLATPQVVTGHYVRLTWSTSGSATVAALTPVAVEAVKTVPRVLIDMGTPSAASDGAIEWSNRSNPRATGLQLQTSASNALMPLRVLTRARSGDPWLPVTSTVVYRLTNPDGSVSVNPVVPVRSPLLAQTRIEPLSGYSLAGLPLTLAVEHAPLQVVFVATGNGPFTISTGKPGLTTAALPIATLIPNYTRGAEFSLPLQLASADAADTTQPAPLAVDSLVNRSMLLWLVLLLAVIVLAALAISLLRSPVKR